MELKTCSKCGGTFPATVEYFHRNNWIQCGLRPSCKICRKDEHNNYYQKNKNKILEREKPKHEDKGGTINQRKEYYIESKEQIQNRRKKHYQENKDKYNESRSKWRNNNKDKFHAQATRNKQIRKAHNKNLSATYTTEQWVICKDYFNSSCCYCGRGRKLTQDHFIPLSKGGEYTHNNIVCSCRSCNSGKYNSDFFEWYPRQPFYSIARERKILKYLNYKSQDIQQLALL